jgi:hypothetical protein
MEEKVKKLLKQKEKWQYLGGGGESECFLIDNWVIKLYRSENQEEFLAQKKHHYDLLQKHLSPYVVPTEYFITKIDGKEVVVGVQPFIKGRDLQDFLQEELHPKKLKHIKRFFKKSIKFYAKTELLPDLFFAPHANWYFFITKPNVKISEDNQPLLIDTGIPENTHLEVIPFLRKLFFLFQLKNLEVTLEILKKVKRRAKTH